VLAPGKVRFGAERLNPEGHADRFWAVVMLCQRERLPARLREVAIGVRVIG